jgi:hypothetical protein
VLAKNHPVVLAIKGSREGESTLTHTVNFWFPARILAYSIIIWFSITLNTFIGIVCGDFSVIEFQGRGETGMTVKSCLWSRQWARFPNWRGCRLDHVVDGSRYSGRV